MGEGGLGGWGGGGGGGMLGGGCGTKLLLCMPPLKKPLSTFFLGGLGFGIGGLVGGFGALRNARAIGSTGSA